MKRNSRKVISLALAATIVMSSGVILADRDNRDNKKNTGSIYSSEEIRQINSAGEQIRKEHREVSIISVEDIVSRRKLKFDTPPVIKENRTLVPVRAISEGFKATVEWVPESKEIIIKKDDKTIVLKLGTNKVVVDGVEKTIDSEAQILSNRTYVPLRFIAEELGTKISYKKETGKIELDDELDEIKDDLEEDIEELKETLQELEEALKDEDKVKLAALKDKIQELENELKALDIDFESYGKDDETDDDADDTDDDADDMDDDTDEDK